MASATSPTAPASMLNGMKLSGGWTVIAQHTRGPNSTGGNFGCGYTVEGAGGKRAFLKALDYSGAMRSPDPARMLQLMTETYNFERDLLARCRDFRMDKVVRILDDGSVSVPAAGGEIVQYLIFEHADGGDVRNYLSASKTLDLAWGLRALHHVATGLNQLHKREIAHQDLKPSNVLLFQNGKTAKVGDVGRSSQKGHTPPHEHLKIAGDPSYAPPELQYGQVNPDWGARRLACDCYLLGSLILFVFTGVSATPAILSRMLPSLHPRGWTGTFVQVLPHVRDAFDQVVKQFENNLLPALRKDLPVAVRQLCDPDPTLRGHPRDKTGLGSAYSLERYISLLDNLAKKAELGIIK